MVNLKKLIVAGAIAAALVEPAFAAIYIKYDGVDGEAKAASFGRGSGGMQSLDLTLGEDPVAVGLLLPAVQNVREASARTTAQGRPKSFSTFAFDDGRKTWTLHDATATPNGPNQVKILFRCKDWLDQASGDEGSDCAGVRAKAKAAIEPEWKVEEGRK